MESRRFVRKTSDEMVAGVCAGISDYLRIDVTIVRLVFFFLIFADGIGIPLYIILWIVMPAEGAASTGSFEEQVEQRAEEFSERVQEIGHDIQHGGSGSNQRTNLVIGGGLILVGLYYLMKVLPINLPFWVDFDFVWPLVIIAGGVLLLVRRVKED